MKNDFETLIKENEMNETKGENEDLIEGESIIRKIHQKDLKVKVEQIHLLFSNDSIISWIKLDKVDKKRWNKDSKSQKDDEDKWGL